MGIGRRSVLNRAKGATSARNGEFGIIPGSMATGSYIVRGLGSEESWQSCSHGAGRRMGRKEAFRNLNEKDFIRDLNDSGVVCDKDARLMDESPLAYKDLSEVIRSLTSSGCIDVVHRLLPLVNVKGY